METVSPDTEAAFVRLARFDQPPDTTLTARTPRRLPQLRSPRWLDQLAAHHLTARVSWTICAVCLTASAVLVAVMLVTGPAPAAPHGSTPRLTPAPSDIPTTGRTTHAAPVVLPSARSSARPTATAAPTATARTSPPAQNRPRAVQPSASTPAEPSPTPSTHAPTPDSPKPTPSTGDGTGATQPANPNS